MSSDWSQRPISGSSAREAGGDLERVQESSTHRSRPDRDYRVGLRTVEDEGANSGHEGPYGLDANSGRTADTLIHSPAHMAMRA